MSLPVVDSTHPPLDSTTCFYTCLSFCSRGDGGYGIPACISGRQAPTQGEVEASGLGGGVSRHTPGGIPTCTEADTPPQQTATAEGGTHPTRMHSRFHLWFSMA